MKRLIQSIFFYLVSGFGISLTILASVGVSSFNSMNVALSDVFALKVGTVTTIINLLFLVLYCSISKNKQFLRYFQMTIALFCFGFVINFFLYTLFSSIIIQHYITRIIIFILGTIIAGFGTGQVLNLETLQFPIEAFCQVLAIKTKHSFAFYRYGLDLLFIAGSLTLSFIFQLPILVREGTLISFLLLSASISWSKKVQLVKLKQKELDSRS